LHPPEKKRKEERKKLKRKYAPTAAAAQVSLRSEESLNPLSLSLSFVLSKFALS